MTDLNRLILKLDSLVIFSGLRNEPVLGRLYSALRCINKKQTESAVLRYCDFVRELYENGGDLSGYVLKYVLEDENIYILKRSRREQAGTLLDECLASELDTLQQLSELTSAELTGRIEFDGFLPQYTNSETDISAEYADRVHMIHKLGYGIYAKHHVFVVNDGVLTPVEYPDPIRLSQLYDYESERQEVINNTLALLSGKPANNVLLYGDCGTGKSSSVKAIANEFAPEGLRLIELKKKQLHEIPSIVEAISVNPLKFVIFIDDLSFTEDDSDYAALKAILEGSVSSTASNLVIYATSNRRHLVRETFSARKGDEIHFRDTMQELLSLSDRFGLTVTFQKPDKKLYLDVTHKLAEQYGIKMDAEELDKKAEAFALARGGRSPRVAKQFIEYLAGRCELPQ
ncbi:MAG: ATP-binding protein [Ruminococcus sp.]|nr:ATP-binding protein [Ruminococcus sp.]